MTRSIDRLRIAYILHDYNWRYGHSRYVAELASRYSQDHEVHVFCNTFDEPNPQGLTFHHVPAVRRNVMTTLLTFALPVTWKLSGRFDIIHSQGFCGFRQNVVTAHMCQDAWLEAMTQRLGRPSWRKRVFHSMASWFERGAYSGHGTQRVIAVSHRVAADLEHYYRPTAPIRVIHHGVDTETFHPRNRAIWRQTIRQEIGVDDTTPLALYVGDYQKGLTPTIQAVRRVPGLHLAGVARSPTEPYRSLIQSEGVADRVHLLPATSHVERYYAAADIFVFPTCYDPFGLVATEAMATGLPVVCSSAAGAVEVIEDGVNGLIVQNPWNPDALAETLRKLTADADLRQRLGEAARQRAMRLTWDEVARQTMAVYREVASR